MRRARAVGLFFAAATALGLPQVSAQDQPGGADGAADYDWGVGVGVMGPAPFVDVQVHAFPAEWLGLSAGGVVLPAAGASAHVGARVRPVSFASVRPFVGAAATGLVALGACDETTSDSCGSRGSSFAGPRAGVEVEIVDGSLLIGVEVDAFWSLTDEPILYADDDGTTWWGGGYFLWLY